jgi:hypothetical protein
VIRHDETRIDLCPFIDDNDERCASRFTLSRLSEAFSHCLGGHRACPTYWKLHRDNPHRLIMPTHHGRPLEPTGS